MQKTLYVVDAAGVYQGQTCAHDPHAVFPPCCVAEAPPLLAPGDYAQYAGGEWHVLTAPPLRPVPAPALRWSDPQLDLCYWWIAPGRLTARLGADALAIAASSHDACKAAVVVLGISQYVDLKGAELGAVLDTLIATQQPSVNPVFPGAGPMTAEKKARICNTPTTEYERHIKELPQPVEA